MSLVKSISGIRGTIGGRVGEGLNALDLVRFTAAYATWRQQTMPHNNTIVVGRDARISGQMVQQIVTGTLMAMGMNVTDIGLATTPTTELAVTAEKAAGGIILTASHNPKQWNALKLLNENGEFLNDKEGKAVLAIAEKDDFVFADVDHLGQYTQKDYLPHHIERVLALPLVNREAIAQSGLKVVVDGINSVGAIAIPALLKALGITGVTVLNSTPDGCFAHNPEPLPQHLTGISQAIKEQKADVGFVVDPDVDRLAIVCENGEMFGEEYTLVSVSDYVLGHTKGNTVSNLSSSRALRDITLQHGAEYTAAAVGEVNVVTEMKRNNAIIGGEGNGGVIYPECHYGRDALVGVALFLSLITEKKKKVSELRLQYPKYIISKNRIDLTPDMDVDKVLASVKQHYTQAQATDQRIERITDIDGVKIDFTDGWVHLRKSNTEPIIRIYSEAHTEERANELAEQVKQQVCR
ncbi:MAG: phosphoglucosamine mutase [Paludibacteraceae bacterium]|nr:phosphoglucosamine mutase [Paludibacteraceae bacterium]